MTVTANRPGRARALAYLFRYQFADFLMLRAGLPALTVTLLGFMIWKTAGVDVGWSSTQGVRISRDVFRMLSGVFIVLGGFMGIARLVTDDRSNGYFRFLFSKPVSIERFYIQQWFLIGIGMVVLTGLFSAWLQAGTGPLPVRESMIFMGLFWILVGGIGFALSAATNLDAVLLVVLYVTSTVLHSLKEMPNSPMWPWLGQVTRLFPPLHKLDYIRDQLYAGAGVPWMHVAHVAGYGILALVCGTVILRRASFAR
ncbi:MAG: hypothetical protein O2973_03145 [Gemmatimonadetes bacterium]|nr:hypothetical protein [Gemmatimonadota bacterium]